MSGARVLVTGASGFVGAALCQRLLALGYQVRGQVLSGRAPPGVHEQHVLDLIAPDAHAAVDELVRDVDHVVHLAALAHRGGSGRHYQQLNVLASLALAQRAEIAGVASFLFVSSIYAGAAADAAQDTYAGSKAQAERLLLAAQTGWRMRLNVLRPALVYDREMKGRLATLVALAQRGLLPILPERGATPMVSRTDLLSALCLLLAHPTLSGNVFHAGDGQHYSLRRISRFARALAGRPAAGWALPPAIVEGLIGALRIGSRIPLLGRALVLPRGLDSWQIDPDARLLSLGWQPGDMLESVLPTSGDRA